MTAPFIIFWNKENLGLNLFKNVDYSLTKSVETKISQKL